MANLQATTVSGVLTIAGNMVRPGVTDITPWYELNHCANTSAGGTATRLHIRTPLPADNVAMGWNPIIMEVVGFHTYFGEHVHDFKALLNTNGYNNAWFGSQIFAQRGTNSAPFVYRSTNTYGGYTRVCIAVNKVTCCCVGRIWVRWINQSGFWNNHPWATIGANDSLASPVNQF
jgi:hypothetical protein